MALKSMFLEIVGEEQAILFADDIAIIAGRVGQLGAVYLAFDEYRKATSLALKVEKCVLVPLLRSGSDEDTCALDHRLLANAVPD